MRRRWYILIPFLWWIVVWAKPWAGLFRTKVWELRQLIGSSEDQQLMIMHPWHGHMAELVKLKQYRLDHCIEYKCLVVLNLDRTQFPLLTNPAIAQYVLFPLPVASPAQAAGLPADVYIHVQPKIDYPLKLQLGKEEPWLVTP